MATANHENDQVLARIIYYQKQQGLSDVELEKKLGLKPKTIATWKQGKSHGFRKLIPQIATLFNVTTDTLLNHALENPTKEEPTSQERLAQDLTNILIEKGILTDGIPLNPQERKRLLDCFDIAADAYKKLRQ